MAEPLRIGFVPGVVPDKWLRRWRERFGSVESFLVAEDEQRAVLDDGRADLCLVRLPLDTDGLHLVRLYQEEPVVVMGTEHPLTLLEEISDADLVGETVNDVPPASAVEAAAAGTGVALLPASLARLHARRDVTTRPYADGRPTQVGLAWLVVNDGPRAQDFVGIVKGRRAGSSR